VVSDMADIDQALEAYLAGTLKHQGGLVH